MLEKRLRVGMVDAVLVAGAATVTWKDPDTINAAAPTQIELEYDPKEVRAIRTVSGGTPGHLTITATKTGCTIASSSGTDTSTIRVTGKVDPE